MIDRSMRLGLERAGANKYHQCLIRKDEHSSTVIFVSVSDICISVFVLQVSENLSVRLSIYRKALKCEDSKRSNRNSN